MQRLGSPPPDDRALTALDHGLQGAPTEDGYVPIQALGWWMRHYGIGATRVRDAAREDLAARRYAFHLPNDTPPRPDRHADDVEVALGGFPATRDEREFVTQLLKAREKPSGPVPGHEGDHGSISSFVAGGGAAGGGF